MFKKILLHIVVCFGILTAGFLTGFITGYSTAKSRLMEQHRVELELARTRARGLTETITDIRKEVRGVGESITRQRTTTAQLRELISEVRKRYEKMEDLLDSTGIDFSITDSIDYSTNSTIKEY